ncbi:MAG: DUF6232 family protein [Syntrophobacteraceae bacterium]
MTAADNIIFEKRIAFKTVSITKDILTIADTAHNINDITEVYVHTTPVWHYMRIGFAPIFIIGGISDGLFAVVMLLFMVSSLGLLMYWQSKTKYQLHIKVRDSSKTMPILSSLMDGKLNQVCGLIQGIQMSKCQELWVFRQTRA